MITDLRIARQPEEVINKREPREATAPIVAAFCITFWLVAVAIAIGVAFLVQNAVRTE